jgi:hypothetical protein
MWIAVVALLLAPVTISAQYKEKVRTDWDPTAPFASYRTYAWTAGTPAENPLAEKRIHDFVEQQLALRGFTKSDNPDVYMATILTTKEHQEIYANGFYGGYWYGGPLYATVETTLTGTLIVDMYDAKTKQLVWRGTRTDNISSKPSKNTERADEAITKMFAKYPYFPPQ